MSGCISGMLTGIQGSGWWERPPDSRSRQDLLREGGGPPPARPPSDDAVIPLTRAVDGPTPRSRAHRGPVRRTTSTPKGSSAPRTTYMCHACGWPTRRRTSRQCRQSSFMASASGRPASGFVRSCPEPLAGQFSWPALSQYGLLGYDGLSCGASVRERYVPPSRARTWRCSFRSGGIGACRKVWPCEESAGLMRRMKTDRCRLTIYRPTTHG
jgi:hypothetical protein